MTAQRPVAAMGRLRSAQTAVAREQHWAGRTDGRTAENWAQLLASKTVDSLDAYSGPTMAAQKDCSTVENSAERKGLSWVAALGEC